MEVLIFDTHRPLSAIISFSVCAAPSHGGCLFTPEKTCDVSVEANKKVPLKCYSLEIRIDSVNQILRNKEKVK